MGLVYEWARVVALAVLFAGLVEMLITSEDMARFVRLILGLVVFLAIMSPALALVQQPWITTSVLPALRQDPLAAGNRAWEQGMSRQIVRLVENVEGAKEVQARLTGTPSQGITSVRVWGRLSLEDSREVEEVEEAISATLAAYYGVSPERVTVNFAAQLPKERGGE